MIRPSIKLQKLAFLDMLISRRKHVIQISIYRKPTSTERYPNFDFHQPYNVEKRIVRCLLQVIDGDPVIWTRNGQSKPYPTTYQLPCVYDSRSHIKLQDDNNTQKSASVSLPYVKCLSEKICGASNIRTSSKSSSTLCSHLFRISALRVQMKQRRHEWFPNRHISLVCYETNSQSSYMQSSTDRRFVCITAHHFD